MNFSDFIKDNGKRVNKQYYLHLIQVSKADGKIKPEELELLHKEGKKFGLTDPEIDKLIDSEAGHYDPPYLLQEKFDHLYNVAEMILADESVTEGERKLLKRFAIEAGFSDKTIAKLIELLLTGIKKGEDEETLLKRFRTEILFQD
ncbi:MAG: hypothetical protein WAW07_03885 [Bacteroidales bacterium]